MLLKWINHAGFLLESGPVRLLCDPWLQGAIFNHGWSLLSPTSMAYEDFCSVTHIWFSHEHPDHFYPPNLKLIPVEYRRKITVLFQDTKDKRVVNLCKSLEFQVEELPLNQRISLAPDFDILCGTQDDLDSWSAVFAEGMTILNMNDCVFERDRELVKIREQVGELDVLLSQFSYAAWIGNPEDRASHRRHAARKRLEMARLMRAFQPKYFIPFASFIYFSHAENFYMNAALNRIADVYDFTMREVRVPTVILYPGDTWEVATAWDSTEAIRRYEADFIKALGKAPFVSPAVEMNTLQGAADSFFRKCAAKNNQVILNRLPAAVAHLQDLGVDVELSFRKGMSQVKDRKPDIIISSDSLLNCLTTEWGGETLTINGRFQVPARGRPRRFFWIFRVSRYNSFGDSLNLGFVCTRLVHRAVRSLAA